jgi:hypothetical protein
VRQLSQRLLDSIKSIYGNDFLTIKGAFNSDDSENYKKAVKLEYKLLINKKTWR